MFDISWTEFLLIGVVALIVIGPKELPAVMRTMGQWTRKVRSMAADFQGQFQEAMREAEMADLKKQVDDIAQDVKNYDPLKDVRADVEAAGKDIQTSLEEKPALMTAATEPAPTEPLPAPETGQDVVAAVTGPVAPEAVEQPAEQPPVVAADALPSQSDVVAAAIDPVALEAAEPETVETAAEPDSTRRAG
jgi:sec-independent protein translocase protein TatB